MPTPFSQSQRAQLRRRILDSRTGAPRTGVYRTVARPAGACWISSRLLGASLTAALALWFGAPPEADAKSSGTSTVEGAVGEGSVGTGSSGRPGAAPGTTAPGGVAIEPPGGPPRRPRFELTDHRGEVRTQEDFRGSLLVYFGFTRCPDVCPLGLGQLSAALRRMGETATHFQPVFVSVDTKRDKPETLAPFVAYFHPRLIGLTGDKFQVFKAVKSFGVRYFNGNVDGRYEVSHSDRLHLVAPDGTLLGSFPGNAPVDGLNAALVGIREQRALASGGAESQQRRLHPHFPDGSRSQIT